MVRALCLLLLPMGHGEEEGGLLQVGNKKVISHQVGPPGESLSEAASRAAQKQQQLALLVERISQLETAVGERVHGKPHDCKSGKCKTVKASTFDETVVKTALDSNMLVIGELSQEHQEQQLLIDQSNNGIVSCNAQLDKNFDGVEGVNLLKIQMEHKRKAHESCRLQQVGYTTERDTACEEYYRYADVTQASHPPCLCDDATGKPSQNAEQYSSYSTEALTEADAITDCYQQKKAWVKKYQVLVEKQSLCKNSATTCQYEVDKCAKFQVDFEEAYCAYGSKLQETCRDFASCLSPADCKPLVQQRVDLIANLKLWENTQKEVFKAVKTMDCLMYLMSPLQRSQNLVVDNAAILDDLSNCQNLVVDTSHLDLTYPYNVDEPKSCDDSQVTYLPGQVAWKEAEYSEPSWRGYVQTVKSCTYSARAPEEERIGTASCIKGAFTFPNEAITGSHSVHMELTMPAYDDVDDEDVRQWILNVGQEGSKAQHWLWSPTGQFGTSKHGDIQFGPWNQPGQIKDFFQKGAKELLAEASSLTTTYNADTGAYNLYMNKVLVAGTNVQRSTFQFTSNQLLVALKPRQFGRHEVNFKGCVHAVEIWSRELPAAEALGERNGDRKIFSTNS